MEKKNTGLIVTIILLIVIVLGLGGYIVYDKFLKDTEDNKEVAEVKENTEVLLSNGEELKETIIDGNITVGDLDLKTKYNENLSGAVARLEAFYYYKNPNKLEEYDFENKMKIALESSFYNREANSHFQIIISKEDAETAYKNLFGNYSYYENKSIGLAELASCDNLQGMVKDVCENKFIEYKDDSYIINTFPFGGEAFGSSFINKIVSVKNNNETVEITKKLLFCRLDYKTSKHIIYDSDNYFSGENVLESVDAPSDSYGCYNVSLEEKFSTYESKLTSFIFVFKKDSANNYYLYEIKKNKAN